MRRMPVDDEMTIRRIGVHACRRVKTAPGQSRYPRRDATPYEINFLVRDLPVYRIRRADGIFSAVMCGNLHATTNSVHRGQTVRVRAILRFPNPHREFFRRERANTTDGLEPELHLPLHL